ncbi:MAG: NTP transferase domain-containing protein [Gemmatimonadetes bacterium]|nr:NTP transferase domain-containing protein [Gemmatimonadota bacterium]
MSVVAVILAAGEGKRMKSDLPKVLHEAAGEPLLAHVGNAARESGADRIIAVIGNGAPRVRERFAESGWDFVEQTERLGTADAVKRAIPLLKGLEGDALVLAGDVPLLRGRTLSILRERHHEANAAATVLTARLPDPTGYGRIVRGAEGEFLGIVEHKDATESQRAVDEVNSSIYCFSITDLVAVIDRIGNDNAQGEYYLTDAIGLLRAAGRNVLAVNAAEPEEILGVNDREQLAEVERLLLARGNGS